MTSFKKREDYAQFLHLDPEVLEEQRAQRRIYYEDKPAVTIDQYFLQQSLQLLQSMTEAFEDGVKLINESRRTWQNREDPPDDDDALDRLLLGLRQNFLIQKSVYLAFDKSIKMAAKYFKWLEDDDLSFKENFDEALERLDYALDPETGHEFESFTVQGFNELRCRDFNALGLKSSSAVGEDDEEMIGSGPRPANASSTAVKKEDSSGSESETQDVDDVYDDDDDEEAGRDNKISATRKTIPDGNPDSDLLDIDPNIEVKFEAVDCVDEEPAPVVEEEEEAPPPPPRQYTCHYCGKVFGNKTKHTVHLRVHTKEKPYRCKICHKTYSTLSSFNEHKNVHRNDKFACKLCGKTLKNRLQIVRHMRTVHKLSIKTDDLKNERCEECGKRFFTKEDLDVHAIVHRGGFKCDECGKAFKSANFLGRHQRMFNCSSQGNSEAVNSETLSAESSDTQPALDPGQGDGEDAADANFENGGKSFQPFVTIRSKQHERQYKCGYCEKVLRTKTKAEEHVRSHTKEKPFTCDICYKSFSCQRNLKYHYDLHSGVVFPCLVCGKTMRTRPQANRHMRSEHSEVS